MSHPNFPSIPFTKPPQNSFDIGILMSNHRKRISQLRHRKSSSRINDTSAYRDMHQYNPKKQSILENQYTEIQRENRVLFEKIVSMRGRKGSTRRHSSFSQNQIGSLNTTFRKHQIQQIERENVKMFGRIQNQKASISFRETDRDYFKNKEISQRLSNLSKNKLQDWYS